MTKRFSIPKLNKENWRAIQDSLDSLGTILADLMKNEKDLQKRKDLELTDIHLGMIDMYLGRNYTLDELKQELERARAERDKNN